MQRSALVKISAPTFRSRPRLSEPMYGPLRIIMLLLPFFGLFAIGVVYPLTTAATVSLTSGEHFGAKYAELAGDRLFWIVLGRTIKSAALVSAISLAIAYPTAEFINRASPKYRPVLLALVLVPVWSSAVARIYGWFGLFVRNGAFDQLAGLFGVGPLKLLYNQPAVVVGMVHVSLPLLILSCYAALRAYDDRLSKASLSLGASRLRTLLQVKLPILAAPILAGTVGTFLLALGFFEVPALLGGPGSQLISNLIYQQMFNRYDFARAQAMSLLLLVATLIILSLLALMMRLVRTRLR